MSLKQQLYRPLPKIITTYHFGNPDYKMESPLVSNINNGSLDRLDNNMDDICKCSFCVKNEEQVKRCVCARRSPSPFRKSPSPFRRSPSPMASYGYDAYQKGLLEVPFIPEYGDASSDDLSSEWDSDVPDVPPLKTKVGIICFCFAISPLLFIFRHFGSCCFGASI